MASSPGLWLLSYLGDLCRYIGILICLVVFWNNGYTIAFIFIWKIAIMASSPGLWLLSYLGDLCSYIEWLVFGYLILQRFADDLLEYLQFLHQNHVIQGPLGCIS